MSKTYLPWDDESVKMLEWCVSEGMSSGQIARKMGISRNTVIGKISRLRLKLHRPPNRRGVPAWPLGPRLRTHQVREVIPATDPGAMLFDGAHRTMLTVGRQECRWPYGEPSTSGFHFCGRPTGEGKSYCPYHTARGTIRVGKKDLNTREFEGRSKFVFAMTEKAA